MRIIGWIRVGDKAACGGVVAEGDPLVSSNGIPYSFEGARMSCASKCVIAEGYEFSTLANRRHRVLHGMRTSCGCPLYSTLNDRDGVGNGAGNEVPEKYFRNADGRWEPIKAPGHDDPKFDEQTRLTVALTAGLPFYIETMDGRTFDGKVDESGLLPRIDTFGEDEYTVYWGDEALARIQGASA